MSTISPDKWCVMNWMMMVILSFLLTGCTTAYLWSNPPKTDQLIGFYGVEGEDTLLWVGQNYTYVFRNNPELKAAVMGSQSIAMNAEYSNFHVDADNRVTGTYLLTASKPTPDVEKKLAGMGFVSSTEGRMMRIFYLSGTRYLTEGHPPFTSFTQRYLLQYDEDFGMSGYIGRAVFTPFTVVIDAAAVVALIILNGHQIPVHGKPGYHMQPMRHR